MSVSASLDISLETARRDSLSVVDIISFLIDKGWNIVKDNRVFYLPLNDADNFSWREDTISENEFFRLAREREAKNEVVGVAITWKDSRIGGTLLVYPNGKLTFNMTQNRKIVDIPASDRVTDVNWYLERLLPCFNSSTILVESFVFTQG